MLFLFLVLFCAARPGTVQAASSYELVEAADQPVVGGVKFRVVEKKNGEQSLYAQKGGKEIRLEHTSSSRRVLNTEILTNGSTVYYAVRNRNKGISVIYQIRSSGTSKKKIHSTDMSMVELCGYYNGKLYYSEKAFDGSGAFCCQTLKTGKKKILAGFVDGFKQFDDSFCLAEYNDSCYRLKLYSASTGKMKTLTKWLGDSRYGSGFRVASGKIYYAEFSSSGVTDMEKGAKINVKYYNTKTGKTKTLASNLKVYGIRKIYKNRILYYNKNGKGKTKKY